MLKLSGGVNTTLCVFWVTILVQSAEMHLETLKAAQNIEGNVADNIVIGSTLK